MEPSNLVLFCTIIGTAIAIIGAMVSIIRYYQRKAVEDAVKKARLDKMESDLSRLPCDRRDEVTSGVRRSVDALPCTLHRSRIDALPGQIKSINDSVVLLGLAQRHSPLSPTEKGWKAIRDRYFSEAGIDPDKFKPEIDEE